MRLSLKMATETGFVHEWRSIPFTITAHELTTELFEQVEAVFEVEGLLFFDDHFALKRDATASRLRPKARKEVQEDKEINGKTAARVKRGQTSFEDKG